jgi:ribonuclease D
MESEIRWIRDSTALTELVGRVGSGPLSLDTEADSMHHYPEKVCLVQLSLGGRDYLVDPLSGVDPRILDPVLREPTVRKILHGADYDLRVLHRDFGLEVRGLFDTMVAARLVGERVFGLAALLESRFGVRVDKRFQRADWSRRPLPEEMQRYAVADTRHLEPLADRLEEELQRLGRSAWAEEEFRRLEGVRWSERSDDEPFRRIKGASALDRRALGVLRELVAVREEEARRCGRPPFRVMPSETLLRIASAAPRDRRALSRIRGLPTAWKRDRGADRVLDAIRRVMELPETELPEMRASRRRKRDVAFERKLRALCRERDAVAETLGIEPSVLAPKAALQQALELLEQGRDPRGAADLRRWQADLLRPSFGRLGA